MTEPKYRILINLAIAVMAGLGCHTPGLLPIEGLCGGQPPDEVTLRARLDGQGESFGRTYMAANGILFFYVAQNCEYWVKDGSWATSHGSLSDADLELVQEALNYRELPRLAGRWSARGCYDSSFLRVSASGSDVICECNCDSSDTPAGVREIETGFEQFVQTMVERGRPWSGALEILVVEDETLADQPLIEWPLSRELETFVVSAAELRAKIEGDEAVQGTLVDDPAEARLLRETMLTFAEEHPDKIGLGSPLPVRSKESYFALYARDSLPEVASLR